MPHDLIWPRPLTPFTGFNFTKTAETVRRFQSPAWCAVDEPAAEVGYEEERLNFMAKKKGRAQRSSWDMVEEVRECPQHRCSFRILLNPEIDRLEDDFNGLDLERDIGV
jgi:hypothetical protein